MDKKKKTSKTTMPAASAVSLSEIQQQVPFIQPTKTIKLSPVEFENLVQQQVQLHLNQVRDREIQQKHIESAQDLERLHDILKEYLGSFILIGYTIKDDRVLIQNAVTHKDKDALMELMKNIFVTLQQNGGSLPDKLEEDLGGE